MTRFGLVPASPWFAGRKGRKKAWEMSGRRFSLPEGRGRQAEPLGK